MSAADEYGVRRRALGDERAPSYSPSRSSTLRSQNSFHARRGLEYDTAVVDPSLIQRVRQFMDDTRNSLAALAAYIASLRLIQRFQIALSVTIAALGSAIVRTTSLLYCFLLNFPGQLLPRTWWAVWSPPNEVVLLVLEHIISFFVRLEIVDSEYGRKIIPALYSRPAQLPASSTTSTNIGTTLDVTTGVATPNRSSTSSSRSSTSSQLSQLNVSPDSASSNVKSLHGKLVVVYTDGGVYDLLIPALIAKLHVATGKYPRAVVNPLLWKIPFVKQVAQYFGTVPGDGLTWFMEGDMTRQRSAAQEIDAILEYILAPQTSCKSSTWTRNSPEILIVTQAWRSLAVSCAKRGARVVTLGHAGFNEQFFTAMTIPISAVDTMLRTVGLPDPASTSLLRGVGNSPYVRLCIPSTWRRVCAVLQVAVSEDGSAEGCDVGLKINTSLSSVVQRAASARAAAGSDLVLPNVDARIAPMRNAAARAAATAIKVLSRT